MPWEWMRIALSIWLVAFAGGSFFLYRAVKRRSVPKAAALG